MQAVKKYNSYWMRPAVRAIFAGCLSCMLFAVSAEQHRSGVKAGATHLRRAGKLYVISVGINAYPKSSHLMQLTLAAPDAQSVASAFSTKEVGNAYLGNGEVMTFFDSSATLKRLRSAFQYLVSASQPEDVVVFYFAGFGLAGNGPPIGPVGQSTQDFHFALFDTSASWSGTPYNATPKVENSLTARELSLSLLSMKARRQIIILDTGRAAIAFSSLQRALNSDSIFTLRDASRRFALLGVEGTNAEVSTQKHGFLTAPLLKGMQGDADANHDGVITEGELEGYIMVHMQDTATGFDGQLLSYSDLRGLCLSATTEETELCNADYGYDASLISRQAMRGTDLVEPPPLDQTTGRGTDYGLIIAANTYDHWPKLENPIYDGQTLQHELIQNFGYSNENIVYEENPAKRKIHDALSDLQHHSFGENDRLFIYIAGHGFMNDAGQGFIVARDTLLPSEDPYLDSGLSLSALRDAVDGLPVRHILIVLDVCYGGTFKERKQLPAYTTENLDSAQPLDLVIANKMKSPSRLYIASGGLRQAFDGAPGRHSPFARTFLKTLRQYGGEEHLIDIGKLDGAVYGLCPHPYYGIFGSQQEGEDFIFVPRPDAQKVPDPGLEVKVEGPHCSS